MNDHWGMQNSPAGVEGRTRLAAYYASELSVMPAGRGDKIISWLRGRCNPLKRLDWAKEIQANQRKIQGELKGKPEGVRGESSKSKVFL